VGLVNGVSWLYYSVQTHNPLMFAAGAVAAASGTHAFLITHAHAEPSMRTSLDRLILCSTLLFFSMSLLLLLGHPQSHLLVVAGVGLQANLSCPVTYLSPLQHVLEVIRTQDSSSIYRPWSALQLLQGFLWTGYSVCVADAWIAVASSVGVLAAGVALILKVLYPETAAERGNTSQDPAEGWDLPKGWEGLEEGGGEDDFPKEGEKGFLDGPGEVGTAVAVL